MKGLYEIWGQGSSYEELKEEINSYPDDRKLPYLTEDSTFRIIVDSFGKAISFKDQTARIHGMSYIPFKVFAFVCFSCLYWGLCYRKNYSYSLVGWQMCVVLCGLKVKRVESAEPEHKPFNKTGQKFPT